MSDDKKTSDTGGKDQGGGKKDPRDRPTIGKGDWVKK